MNPGVIRRRGTLDARRCGVVLVLPEQTEKVAKITSYLI